MATETSKGLLWTGRVMTALAGLFMLFDGGFQVIGSITSPEAVRAMLEPAGIPVELAPFMGTAILISTILYLIPRTAVLGAILVTGYLGGAIAIDMRVSGPLAPGQIVSIVLGLLVWGGLYFREAKLRALIPFNSAA